MDAPLRRLHPAPTSDDSRPNWTVDEAYAAALGRHHDRSWVGLCMVSSIDGSTFVDGTSSALSSPTDTAVLLRLRALADVIIVGAGTVRGEGYGRPGKAGQRLGVVTLSGSVDLDSDLFASGAGFVITAESTDVSDLRANGVDVIQAGSQTVDLRAAISRLDTVCDSANFVQAEGGPTLNAALADADLIDEINLTITPATVGGNGARLTSGAADHRHRFELSQLTLDDQSFVFSRWLRRESTSP